MQGDTSTRPYIEATTLRASWFYEMITRTNTRVEPVLSTGTNLTGRQ